MKFITLFIFGILMVTLPSCSAKKRIDKSSYNGSTADLGNDVDSVSQDQGEERIKRTSDSANTADGQNSTAEKNEGAIGCVQGRIVDGHLNQPLEGVSIFSLVAANKVEAQMLEDGSGDYLLCGIPIGRPYPIFATKDGFAAFQSYVEIPGKGQRREMLGEERLTPTVVGNIRMYGLNGNANNFTINVMYLSEAVEGAKIRLLPTGSNFFDEDPELFLQPHKIYQDPIEVETDADGNAVISESRLVYGGRYSFTIVPPADSGAPAARSTATVGVIEGTQTEPDRIAIGLESTNNELTLISNSFADLEVYSLGPSGSISLTFSQQVSTTNLSIPDINFTDSGVSNGFTEDVDIIRFAILAINNGYGIRITPEYYTVDPVDGDESLSVFNANNLGDGQYHLPSEQNIYLNADGSSHQIKLLGTDQAGLRDGVLGSKTMSIK